MIYADALFEGSSVEVDAGYAEPNQHALMIRAIITKVTLSYPDSGIPTLTLEGEDKAIMMGLKEKKALWRNMTVTAAVRKIAGPYFKNIQAQLSRIRRSFRLSTRTERPTWHFCKSLRRNTTQNALWSSTKTIRRCSTFCPNVGS
jgi:hypothetical protein